MTPQQSILTFLTSNRFLPLSFSFPVLVEVGALSTSISSIIEEA